MWICRQVAIGVGLVAEQAAKRKLCKYAELPTSYIFQPIAVENLNSFDLLSLKFLNDLGNNIRLLSGEDEETAFLFQRISVVIQRFNSVLLSQSIHVAVLTHV